MWNKKEMSQLDATLTRVPLTLTFDFELDLDLWPWNFKVKLYLGNGRLDCHGTKATEVVRMPWCKTQPLCDPEAEDIVTDGWLKMWAFPSTRLVSPQICELNRGVYCWHYCIIISFIEVRSNETLTKRLTKHKIRYKFYLSSVTINSWYLLLLLPHNVTWGISKTRMSS